MSIDLLSMSAHKFHGAKGVGVLYARRGCVPEAYMDGGEQEYHHRAGTENVADIVAEVSCTGHTGVEMEALTVYDMCKAVQKDIVISDIRLLKKAGGVHGDFTAE